MKSRNPAPKLSPANVSFLLSNFTRWRILDVLSQKEAQTVKELAESLAVPATNISKHVRVLLRLSILEQRYGATYSLCTRFLVPGERTLDFGCVLLKLDHTKI